MPKTSLRLEITFRTAVHQGSGYGAAGIVDRGCLRDDRGIPYLAGSSLKGKFRYAAGVILRSEGANGRALCGWNEGKWCREGTGCDFCLTFGSPMRAAKVRFSDAYPEAGIRNALDDVLSESPGWMASAGSEIRSTTSISRKWHRAETERLFSTEVVVPGIGFVATIEGQVSDARFALLRDCAKLISEFGANSSRGMGSCEFKLVRAA